jgi:YidC/Oxa1 family membrane protein insertase
METRRYILAIGLSMVVLIVYMQFIAPQPPIEQPPQQPEAAAPAPAGKQEAAPTAPSKPKAAAAAKSIAVATKGRDIVIETNELGA